MSVPRPWPDRRPLFGLILAIVAWVMAVLYLVVALVGDSADLDRWPFVLLWFAIGAVWFWQWRRAVRTFDRRTGR